MFGGKKDQSKNNNNRELVRQDPRTKVRTTSAQTETTNTTVQNATIFNNNTNTVTYQTTRQTVTHQQQARVTEICTRRTATPEELLEMVNSMQTNDNGNRSPITNLISKYETKSRIMPNLEDFKTEETTVTQKTGRTVTSNLQEERIKLHSTGRTMNFPSTMKANAKTDSPFAATKTAGGYTSPYTQRNIGGTTKSNYSNDARPITTLVPQSNIRNYSAYNATTRPTIRSSSSTPSTIASSSSTQSSTSNPFLSEFRNSSTSSLPTLAQAQSQTQKSPKIKLKPGCVYIINNVDFKDDELKRVGSDNDVKSLLETFERFQMKVEHTRNPKKQKIKDLVRKIEVKNYSERSCLVIVILSHGSRNENILAADGFYNVNDDVLFPILRNRSLIDKPKIFLIQACKGEMEVGGFDKDAHQPHGPPSEVLKLHSTFEGYTSYRCKQGTPFIQQFCENLKRDGMWKHIEEIMNSVISDVKTNTGGKQIPSKTSTMTKPFVFGDYIRN